MPCPDCDAELEPIGPRGETQLRPAAAWSCPDCGARWTRDYSGLLTEADDRR